jgi:hypothetical protein
MVSIFVSHAKEDEACAERIRRDLEARGYHAWREPPSLSLNEFLYPRTVENVILGSAAVVLVWSSHAARSAWVERYTLFAQSLQKPLLPVMIDATALPATLAGVSPVAGQPSCTHVVEQLAAHLPAPDRSDALIALSEQASSGLIHQRKEAIDHAAVMLQHDEFPSYRESILALLEYLARNDLMPDVRTRAQHAIDVEKGKEQTGASSASRHSIAMRCHNGHINYFDKRIICHPEAKIARTVLQSAGIMLDELVLACPQCGAKTTVHVDCRGYR